MSDTALKEKLDTLQSEFSDWALNQGLIHSGDVITLSYTLLKEPTRQLLDMPLTEFFSLERSVDVRVANFARAQQEYEGVKTVRNIIEHQDIVGFFRYPNFGPKSRRIMIAMMIDAKLPIPDTEAWQRVQKSVQINY